MEITADTANAAMNLAGGILAFLAALTGLCVVAMQSESASTALLGLSVRAGKALLWILSIIGPFLFAFSNWKKVGLGIMLASMTISCFDFARKSGSASRTEILAIVTEIVIFSWCSLAYLFTELLTIVGKLSKLAL